ncbi:MAG TPA: FtsX-like permease family protein [Candidatus Binataceae bacterium]|nr:FtsX-like permease family protein [Candidatus Binataceae bacterium]
MTREFRSLGANVVLASKPGVQTAGARTAIRSLLSESAVESGLKQVNSPDVSAAAPYLYIVARANDSSVVVAGTWLDEIQALAPTWKIEGARVASRSDLAHCLVGRNVAATFNLQPGGTLVLSYLTRTARVTVAGIIDAGGDEDDQIFLNLPAVQELAATPGGIELWQFSVTGTNAAISGFVQSLASQFPALDVRPIRQITQSEGDLLNRIRGLIVGMAVLILVLTALCVLATMAALAMERREDVGLMKAIGGSISRVMALFLAEVGALGAIGGLLGCIAGMVLSDWMGHRVFGTAISPRWEVFPFTIAVMIGVSLAAALPLRLLGNVKPAVIFRGE